MEISNQMSPELGFVVVIVVIILVGRITYEQFKENE